MKRPKHIAVKTKLKNGKEFFLIFSWCIDEYYNFITKRFDTFGELVVFVRKRELAKIAKQGTVCGFEANL